MKLDSYEKRCYQLGWRDAYHNGKYANPFCPKSEKRLHRIYNKGYGAGCDSFEKW